jgi:hypothetical protein
MRLHISIRIRSSVFGVYSALASASHAETDSEVKNKQRAKFKTCILRLRLEENASLIGIVKSYLCCFAGPSPRAEDSVSRKGKTGMAAKKHKKHKIGDLEMLDRGRMTILKGGHEDSNSHLFALPQLREVAGRLFIPVFKVSFVTFVKS